LAAFDVTEAGFIFAFVSNGFSGFSRTNSPPFQCWHPACKGSCKAGGKIRRSEKRTTN
jgi:hypothetical protein